jgi:drug/metabolite transporter (DMT)-like permease
MTPKELLILIFGTTYIWVVDSAVLISGSHLTQTYSIHPAIILFWLYVTRIVGYFVTLCIYAWQDFIKLKKPKTINFNKECLVISSLPYVGIVGWYCYFRLVKFGEMSIISPIISVYILIPIIIAMIIRKKKFTLFKSIAIALCIIASILLSIESHSSNSIKDNIGIQVACFLGVFISWGIIDTRTAIHDHSKLSNSGIVMFTILSHLTIVCILGIVIQFIEERYKYSNVWISFWISNIMQPSSWLVFINISNIDVSISLPLYSLSFMFPAVWALLFLNDTVNPFKIASLTISTVAIIILIIASCYQIKKDKKNKKYTILSNPQNDTQLDKQPDMQIDMQTIQSDANGIIIADSTL